MLAKALQINSRLRCIYWDRNNTSPQGFATIAAALEKYVQASFSLHPFISSSSSFLGIVLSHFRVLSPLAPVVLSAAHSILITFPLVMCLHSYIVATLVVSSAFYLTK